MRIKNLIIGVATAAAMLPARETLDPARKARIEQSFGRLPMRFEANRGQTAREVRYLSRGRGHALFLTDDAAVLRLKDKTVRMSLAGAARRTPQGEQTLPGVTNYLTGRNESKWTAGVESFARVRYTSIYPGVDLVYYGNEGALEYDFVVAPGADTSRIALQFGGASHVETTAAGDLRLMSEGNEVARFRAPVAYQEVNGRRQQVKANYIASGNSARFLVGAYDAARPLIIDPVLAYSTYLGGSGSDQIAGIAIDGQGNAYLTGITDSRDFPISAGTRAQGNDCFITKLNPSGSAMIFSVVFGGSNSDYCAAIAVDASGNMVVGGLTGSADFPTRLAVQPQHGGGGLDGFVAKIGSNGATVQFSTFMGGAGYDVTYGVGILSDGTIAASGVTEFGLPVTQGSTNTGTSAWVARLRIGTQLPPSPSTRVFAAHYGGSGNDLASALAVEPGTDNIWITGHTNSKNLPLQNPLQPGLGGVNPQSTLGDALVARFSPTGALTFGTYLGGSSGDSGDAIAVDKDGSAYVAGFTESSNFPVRGGIPGQAAGYGGFVAKLGPRGITYSTLLQQSVARGVAVNDTGEAFVTGFGGGPSFVPLVPVGAGSTGSAFLARLNAQGNAFLYAVTMQGSNGSSAAFAVAVDKSGNAVAGGQSNSTTFPMQGPIQNTNAGANDAIVFKVSGQ